MKVLYYDCFSGISGDMNLGAMIDIGVDKNYLEKELLKLKIKDYSIKINKDARKGISGIKVDVITQETHVQHFHRGLKEIKEIIGDSELNDNVKNISINIFNNLGEAEAKIHNKNINEIEFHEVGAVDSIIDIVGAAICFDYLKVDKIMSSSIELGGGFARCAHGLIPVPAPAVVELLTGVPIKMGAVPFETTTPTGAAILKTMVSEFTDKKTFIIDRAAYGIGNRDTDIPNVLRVFIGNVIEKENKAVILKDQDTDLSENDINIEDSHFILECNIDDMNPEYYDYIMERLFEEGASDVYLTPIIMKKERPAVKLSVLCSEDTEKLMKEILLKETSTLGVRKYKVEKTMLNRVSSVINTVYGNVRIKISYYNGHKLKIKPEYDDCKRIAKENKVPLSWVYKEINNYFSYDKS
ncbi:MAG: nickel pincer cofactor biosynthesis protein LarC [Bacillota bacterium]|nr:nickel pincer cofactor biosynthesis protein LarC [Bacillota bacterium]